MPVFMESDNDNHSDGRKVLSPAAQRALKEAEERRKAAAPVERAAEIGGRGGEDPARFGDWEIKGRAIDF
jgi:hypothetical protein